MINPEEKLIIPEFNVLSRNLTYIWQCLFELMALYTEQENFHNFFESLFFILLCRFSETIYLLFDFFINTKKPLWQKKPGPQMNQCLNFI